ncbi:hypothetical protein [Pandoraea sp.]|uniref:N-acyl amino acid synthase FeeM domain-containing protein n=1 Tax=Pandoraea sp. TaxID=1883445 RepID=UPI001226E6D9|nr:hypothetical protein [Pandoraea sp.]TAL52986.1 MAG: hypothetical protein EPN80_17130 [Pandoraea sp.]TAM19414.1 MAG: hypothetical protein EPN65_03465 [Pandoraea sp.]
MRDQIISHANNINNTNHHLAAMLAPASQTKVERLPFTVRIARSEQDIDKAVAIRHAAYARHVPDLAAGLKEPEAYDFEDGAMILLAESRLDGAPLGSMRIQTNRFRPLGLEQSVQLPERFKGCVLAEATRLGVSPDRVGRLVKTLLFKAFYMHCLDTGIDWMVITARSPLDRQYEALLFQDVFPQQGFIPMKHVGNIPHRVFCHEIDTAKERWAEVEHPLYDLYFRTHHPDIDVGHQNHLPEFLQDFETRHRAMPRVEFSLEA